MGGNITRQAAPTSDQQPDPEPRTLEAIYEQYKRYVWRTLLRLGVPERYCEDAMQEVFLVVDRRLPEYEPRGRMKGWLTAIAINIARDYQHLRRDWEPMEIIDKEPPGSLHGVAVDMEERVVAS